MGYLSGKEDKIQLRLFYSYLGIHGQEGLRQVELNDKEKRWERRATLHSVSDGIRPVQPSPVLILFWYQNNRFYS